MAPSGWSLESISATCSDLKESSDTPGQFYNTYEVQFEMVYEKSHFGKLHFKEMPMLDWQETITEVNHANRTYWTTKGNRYIQNRTSKTVNVWTQRYITAYNGAMGGSHSPFGGLGTCTLYEKTKSSSGVTFTKVTKLPQVNERDNKAKADAVRDYLAKNGGRLTIVIKDLPGLHKRSETNKERLLLFDVGVIDGSRRWKGYQHLVFNNTGGNTVQTGDFSADATRGPLVIPNGYKKVDPDPQHAMVRDEPLASGEYW